MGHRISNVFGGSLYRFTMSGARTYDMVIYKSEKY